MNWLQLVTVVLTLGIVWPLGVALQRASPTLMTKFLIAIKWQNPPA